MTSEDDRRESSEKTSGERSEPRDSEDRPGGDPRETRTGSEATREPSGDDRRESPKESSGERSEPRDSEDDGSEDADDIPLNIASHDAEKERRQREAADDGMDALTGSTESEAGGEEQEEVDDEASDQDDVLSEFDISEPRSDDDEVEPVELLVQLAEDGEIDPWDIDVVTVTDKFLARLDGSDLRTGGRALFYASVLLRMKSDVMWVDEDEQDEEEWADEPWEMPEGERPEGGGPAVDPFQKLEREMDRRIERKTARGMPETLDELVRDLRERERDTWWKESRTYDTSESPSGFSRGTQTLDYHGHDDFRMDDEPTADDVTGTAHDEHMEDIINDVYVELQSHYDQGRDEVLFAEIREAGGSVVNSFLGVLFLAHRGQVRLQQDDLFGDLWIQDPAAMPAEEAAAADV
ncbi:segregation/condensation protein A [Natronomonas salina]|uniref:segregation/condensation protein A n=1 Tax=Natronomonas salina TaxID=1710540 RepID=UPI0015B39AD4|nr:segregation/condensation protein A [Natronomonas salina]QLD88619.1 segregation/condensation protein A [Natronomonas salina]